MTVADGRRTDVATSAVIREQLSSIVREMRRSMVQSSYSSIIYEGYDFSCVLIDRQGSLIAESGEDHPFHIIPVAGAVAGALAVHGAIGPDDLLLHNDPYTGGTTSMMSRRSGRCIWTEGRFSTSWCARIGATWAA